MRADLFFNRRTFLVSTLASLAPVGRVEAQIEITRPVISEAACPLEIIVPIASDGYRGLGVLRKPPGNGPFPAIICLHAGMVVQPLSVLQALARDAATPPRFLAAGYVMVVPTY